MKPYTRKSNQETNVLGIRLSVRIVFILSKVNENISLIITDTLTSVYDLDAGVILMKPKKLVNKM
jgi:hypothetical protein